MSDPGTLPRELAEGLITAWFGVFVLFAVLAAAWWSERKGR